MYRNSEHALIQTITDELEKQSQSQLHAAINIVSRIAVRDNGIKHCVVQVQCKAGCGYLIEAFGEEAEMLHQKGMMFKSIIDSGSLIAPDMLSPDAAVAQKLGNCSFH